MFQNFHWEVSETSFSDLHKSLREVNIPGGISLDFLRTHYFFM